jgi:hypothetical protein
VVTNATDQMRPVFARLRRWWPRAILALFIAMTFGDAVSDVVQDNDPDDWIPEQTHVAVVEHLHTSCSQAVRPPESVPDDGAQPSTSMRQSRPLDVLIPAGFKAGVDPPPVNLV